MGQATRISAEELQQMLAQAATQHQAGRFEAAAPVYRQILEHEPQHPDALHLLGLALSQLGDAQAALEHIQRAIAARGDCADYHNSLAVILAAMDQADAAADSYRAAIRLRPDYVEPLYNLAGLLHRGGRAEEAADLYRQVLTMRPDDASAHNNLGCVLRDLGCREEAVQHYQEALRLNPQFENAARNLTAIADEDAEDDTSTEPVAWTPPVLITAPTAHGGMTLIQRLLNATCQMVIFGEDPLFFRSIPRMFFEKLALHECLGEEGAAARRRFTEEPTEVASGTLVPDTELYARTVGECFNRIVDMYRTSATAMGLEHWGLMEPLRDASDFGRIRQLMPTARIVFIYRNLFDVARTAKACGEASGPDGMADLARRWQVNLLPILQDPPEDTLVLRYEDLLSNAQQRIAELEAFVELSGLEATVLDPAGEASAPLTDDEAAALRAAASEALAFTSYVDHTSA